MKDQAADRQDYIVEGMTCGHCEASVREELIEVTGVEDITVDLDTGRVGVLGSEVSEEDVRLAVETAGYKLAGRV